MTTTKHAAGAETPAPKTRHGLYFFLMFVLPLVALFVFALLRGNE
jgi:hypothetical protein